MKNIEELFKLIHITPHDISLYKLALTHPSYNADAKTKHHDYERLEYMGDAVLGYVAADLAFKYHPEMEPGNLTKLRSILVKTEALSNYARSINLAEYITVGHSISTEQINASNKILEDVFEALVGAIYLDNKIGVAYKFCKYFLLKGIKNTKETDLTDAKSRLQEEMQAEHREAVHYELINTEGPAHDRVFTVKVMFNDICLATGTGKSKKMAEEDAARKALEKRSI